MEDISALLKISIFDAVKSACGSSSSNLRLRIPSRLAACACPLLGVADADAVAAALHAEAFAPVLEAAPVARVEARNGWLLFTLSDDFYTAALRYVRVSLPLPDGDHGSHTINRMLCLARKGAIDHCPQDASVQRAWLLTLCCGQSRSAFMRAERALLAMTHHLPPARRTALLAACSGIADAAARILYEQIKERD